MYICVYVYKYVCVYTFRYVCVCILSYLSSIFCFIEAEDDQTLEQKKMAKEVAPPLSSVLQMNTSDDVMTYRTAASPAGIYMLEIKAVTSDSTLKMYATTTPDSDHAYPELPSDSDVDILSVSKNTVVLAWKPSPTERVHGQPVQYCLSANKVKNFKTMCAAHGWIFGDQPPTVPPNAGFGFSWEKDFKSGSKDMSSPIKPIGLDHAFFTCIGSKTRFSFNQAVPGEHYYFDIFAVNKLTNRSIAYNGCNVKTKEHFKHVSLKDGKVLRAFLKRSRGGKIFTLDLAHFTKELIFAVEPCAGNLKIQIGKKRKVLKTAIVRGLKSFRFSNVYPGKYKLKVWSSRKRSTSFNVLATTKSSRFPYPKLANDTRIKSFDNLRTCNSVTLAWLGTEKRMQYCLYKRKEPNRLKRLFSRRGGSCTDASTRKKNEKILCRHFRYKAKNRGVLTETVRELQPNTTYVFDVYVSKSRGQTLKYQSAWVTTRSRC